MQSDAIQCNPMQSNPIQFLHANARVKIFYFSIHKFHEFHEFVSAVSAAFNATRRGA